MTPVGASEVHCRCLIGCRSRFATISPFVSCSVSQIKARKLFFLLATRTCELDASSWIWILTDGVGHFIQVSQEGPEGVPTLDRGSVGVQQLGAVGDGSVWVSGWGYLEERLRFVLDFFDSGGLGGIPTLLVPLTAGATLAVILGVGVEVWL